MFQFLNGTIITNRRIEAERALSSFNSSMVRLLRLACSVVQQLTAMFQFLNGTIITLIG